MKKILLALMFGISCYAQEIPLSPPCATDALLQDLIKQDPSLKDFLDAADREIADHARLSRSASSIPPAGTFTIPVVVYIVHDGTAAVNISDARVNDQMLALNNYFANTGLKFCLATKGEGSSASVPVANTSHVQNTPGIIHINNASLSDHSMSEQGDLVALAHNSVVRTKYLRIWVVKNIGDPIFGIAGYSMFPNTSPVFDGIVIRSDVFGNQNSGMVTNYNQGKVLVHEVGHYLGLYHTFEGSCAAAVGDCQYDGDRVCDTPPVSVPNFSCTAGIDTCAGTPSGPDDIHNYMDYGNHLCADHFTTGQIERMLSEINIFRSILVSPDNQIFTGTCGYQNLLASTINASNYSVCGGAAINFDVVNTAGATYLWNFGDAFASGSNPNTATTPSTSHVFSSPANSPYTVTLTVSKVINGVPQTAVSQVHIFVNTCAPIVTSDAYWYVSRTFGLDFKSGMPTFDSTFPGDKITQFACNAQNDASGNLLFYTNNQKVWNKFHQQINTNDLIAPSNWTPNSTMTLIVPKPTPSGQQTQYYIFSNQNNVELYPDQGFKYSLITVSGGIAAMTAERQPIVLPASYGFDSRPDGSLSGGSCVAAVAKCNGYDYWIVTVAKKADVCYFVVFSLTSSGLAYASETMIPASNSIYGRTGNIEVAPNGNKFCFVDAYGQLTRVYDFNKADGVVSANFVSMPVMQIFGATFSPDSQLLYIVDNYGRRIWQYHINSVNIPATGKVISNSDDMPWNIQAGPDGKIYVAYHYIVDRLAVIHTPNEIATTAAPNACNYSQYGPKPTFPVYYGVGAGLPNPIDAKKPTSYFNANTAQAISAYITGCNTYKFFPNICGTSFKWTFTNTTNGTSTTSTETDAVHTFTQNGTYVVTLRDNADVLLGTSAPIVVSNAPAVSILGSSIACMTQPNLKITNNSVPLSEGQTVQWSVTGGSGLISGLNNQPSVEISWSVLPGTITLTLTNTDGCITTATKTITSQCQLGIDEFSSGDITVVPNPSDGIFNVSIENYNGNADLEVYDMSGRLVQAKTAESVDGETAVDLSGLQSGMYLLKVRGDGFSVIKKLLRK